MVTLRNRSAQGAFGLGRKYVTCPVLFERETERIFSRHWLCVGHVSGIGDSGLLPIETEQHKLFLAVENKRIRAFRNFCRHRGSQLVTGKNCHALGQRIQCPYHAWTYDRDGKLVAAPNMDGVADFDAEQYGLVELPCEIVGGFIWINQQPTEAAEEFLSPIASQFESWTTDQLVVAESIRYEVKANWKLIFQNYSECYHCPTVHPILNRLTPYKDADNDVLIGPILGGPMQLSEDTQTMSMDGRLVGSALPNLTTEQSRSVNYFTIFPTMFLSTHPDYVLVHRLNRRSTDQTEIICEFLFHPDVTAASDFDLSRAVEFWDLTNRQDWDVCELAQSGMSDAGYQPGPYSNLESVLAAFDAHYLAVMED